jgi:hypothetical protein
LLRTGQIRGAIYKACSLPLSVGAISREREREREREIKLKDETIFHLKCQTSKVS